MRSDKFKSRFIKKRRVLEISMKKKQEIIVIPEQGMKVDSKTV